MGASGISAQCSVSVVDGLDVRAGEMFCASVCVRVPVCRSVFAHVVCLDLVLIYTTTPSSVIILIFYILLYYYYLLESHSAGQFEDILLKGADMLGYGHRGLNPGPFVIYIFIYIYILYI